MAFANFAQPKTNKIVKTRSLGEFFRNTSRKKKAFGLVIVLAAIGAYFLFFASASPNTCVAVEGGAVCDVDQALHNDDALLNTTDEPLSLGNNGWVYLGTAFKVANFPQNGAKPLDRLHYPALSIHGAYLPGAEKDALLANGATFEGTLGYAWPTEGQPGTVPVYHYERGAPFTHILYTTDKSQGDGWVNGSGGWKSKGIAFYAYPPNYAPPKSDNSTATIPKKNDNCPQSKIALGDSGECVAVLKKMIIGIGITKGLDKDSDIMTEDYVNYVRFTMKTLRDQGKTKSGYNGVVTLDVWQALEFALQDKVNPPPAETSTKCPAEPGDAGLKLFLEGSAAGNKYSEDCIKFWKTYYDNKTAAASLPAAPVYEKCPNADKSQDAGLLEYQIGLSQGKKYDPKKCAPYWDKYANTKAPGAPTTEAVNTDCDTARLRTYSRGDCVTKLKYYMIALGLTKGADLRIAENTFNIELENALKYAINETASIAGIDQGSYREYVTTGQWKAIVDAAVAKSKTPAANTTAPASPDQAPVTPDCENSANHSDPYCVRLFTFLDAIQRSNANPSVVDCSIWENFFSEACNQERSNLTVSQPGSTVSSTPAPKGKCILNDLTESFGSPTPYLKNQTYDKMTQDECKSTAQYNRLNPIAKSMRIKSQIYPKRTPEGGSLKYAGQCELSLDGEFKSLVGFKLNKDAQAKIEPFYKSGSGLIVFKKEYFADKDSCINKAVQVRNIQSNYNVNMIKSSWPNK